MHLHLFFVFVVGSLLVLVHVVGVSFALHVPPLMMVHAHAHVVDISFALHVHPAMAHPHVVHVHPIMAHAHVVDASFALRVHLFLILVFVVGSLLIHVVDASLPRLALLAVLILGVFLIGVLVLGIFGGSPLGLSLLLSNLVWSYSPAGSGSVVSDIHLSRLAALWDKFSFASQLGQFRLVDNLRAAINNDAKPY